MEEEIDVLVLYYADPGCALTVTRAQPDVVRVGEANLEGKVRA